MGDGKYICMMDNDIDGIDNLLHAVLNRISSMGIPIDNISENMLDSIEKLKEVAAEHGIYTSRISMFEPLSSPPPEVNSLAKRLMEDLQKGDVVKHVQGDFKAKIIRINIKQNKIKMEVSSPSAGTWQEDWNLEHTIWGLNNGEYKFCQE